MLLRRFCLLGKKRTNKLNKENAKGYTEYQKKVIRNFYDNKDLRLVQKLGELVSNLYIEISEKKKETGWKKIRLANWYLLLVGSTLLLLGTLNL